MTRASVSVKTEGVAPSSTRPFTKARFITACRLYCFVTRRPKGYPKVSLRQKWECLGVFEKYFKIDASNSLLTKALFRASVHQTPQNAAWRADQEELMSPARADLVNGRAQRTLRWSSGKSHHSSQPRYQRTLRGVCGWPKQSQTYHQKI